MIICISCMLCLLYCGNDASAPKPCLNPESSSDEGFIRSNAIV